MCDPRSIPWRLRKCNTYAPFRKTWTPLYEWTRIKAGRPVPKGHEVIRFAHSNQGRRHPAPSGLFWLLQPPALAQAHAGAAAVLVDEFDARDLKCTSYDLKSGSTRLTDSSLKLVHGYDAHASALGQVLLAPCK